MVGLLVVASAAAYVLRVTVSISAPALKSDLGPSEIQLGLVLSAVVTNLRGVPDSGGGDWRTDRPRLALTCLDGELALIAVGRPAAVTTAAKVGWTRVLMDLPLLLLTLSYFALNCVFYLLVNWFYLAAFTPHAASSASVRNACPRAYSFAMASVSTGPRCRTCWSVTPRPTRRACMALRTPPRSRRTAATTTWLPGGPP